MGEKSKSPAFQFYVRQWLGDPEIMLMDWDARGMHLQLMCIAWTQDDACALPDDDDTLRKWVGNPEPVDWAERLKPQIFRAWTKIDGQWVQEGLRRESIKQKEKSEKRRKAANGRWEKGKSDASAVQKQCPSSSTTTAVNDKKTSPNGEVKERPVRGTRLPKDWILPTDWREWAIAERSELDVDKEADKFRDYWWAKSGKDALKTDWPATWRNWIRNARTPYGNNQQAIRKSAAERAEDDVREYDRIHGRIIDGETA